MSEIYLDYNASAPCDPRVAESVMRALCDGVGNASSAHRFGRRQAAAIGEAREHVAALVGGTPNGVVFTAGATEANNLALTGFVERALQARPRSALPRVVRSAVEHASVSAPAEALAAAWRCEVEVVPVTPGGFVDLPALSDRLQQADGEMLVSVMAANSETGVLNPSAEVAALTHDAGGLLHCDATQMVGRLPFDMTALGCDLVSFSGHKICGPTGVGALVGTRQALGALMPTTWGGGHERGLRSGSLNVAGIVGLGEAARIAAAEQAADAGRIARLRDRFVEALTQELPNVIQNGDVERRLPNTANVRFAGADAEAVLVNMDPVAASAGSACSTGAIEPSPTLTAMGCSRDAAFESVRFSLGRFTSASEVEEAARVVVTAVGYVRRMTTEAA